MRDLVGAEFLTLGKCTRGTATDFSDHRAEVISDDELAERKSAFKASGGYKYPKSQTPWQEIQRKIVDELSEGMVLKPAVKYQKIHKKFGVPRDNH